jgi:cation-transporting ATPase 13A2
MATCHSLRLVDDELIGDPLDLKMFEFTDWIFEEGEGGGSNAQDLRHTEHGSSSGLSPSIVRSRDENLSTSAESVRFSSFCMHHV